MRRPRFLRCVDFWRSSCRHPRRRWFEERHAVQDDAAVHFQLRFARTAQTHRAALAAARAAALTFEVSPEPLQAREHVFVLGQLDLRLRAGRLGAHGEDVEDERRAVEYLDFEFFLDVANLFGRKLVVEDDHADFPFGVFFAFGQIFADFLQFAFANVGHGVGRVQLLREAFHHFGTRRVGQELQFVQIFVGFAFVLQPGDETHQHRSFGLCLRDNKFFH